jgi:hypothetical protein
MRHPDIESVSGSATAGKPGAWATQAEPLALWARRRLVNRTDAWGAYRPPEEWGKEYRRRDGSTGKLGRTTTRKGRHTRCLLVNHFRATGRADVIGLHSTGEDSTSLWGALDIDRHGPTGNAADANLRAALAWHDRLAAAGFRPLLTDSNGAGGYHLRILLAGPAPTPRLYAFLQRLVADHRRHGMTAPPEAFPKQARLDQRTRFGNWLRVPGRHHTHEHWSRVWDGARWLDDAEAVAFILALRGDPPSLLPPEPPPAPTAPRRAWRCSTAGQDGGNLADRAAAYLRRLPNLGEGQGRDDVAYRFAAFLVRDLGLADAVALDWLCLWDQGNSPPKGREALAEILANAARYGRRAVGSGLDTPRPSPSRDGHYTLKFTVEVR